MTKALRISLLILVATLSMFLSCCTKEEGSHLFDLFPLKVGNEYYYSYSYSYLKDILGPGNKSIGNIKWTILTDSLKDNMTEYYFEEKFNGIDTKYPFNDTTTVNDRIRYFKVIEDPSGLLTFWNITPHWDINLKRYHNHPDTAIHNWGPQIGADYYFHADSGLTKYSYINLPNLDITNELYILNSIKIFN